MVFWVHLEGLRGGKIRGEVPPVQTAWKMLISPRLMGHGVLLDLIMSPVYIRASEKVTFFTHV